MVSFSTQAIEELNKVREVLDRYDRIGFRRRIGITNAVYANGFPIEVALDPFARHITISHDSAVKLCERELEGKDY
ncbi:hypothetical protein GOV12_00440 [Candidatus Pacearchaeota archaeon]|nr:hypothetical protein [Candidatus Pacearchaeota archaeon]